MVWSLDLKPLNVVYLGTLLLTLSLALRAIYLFYFHPLATIPGPKSWIFSRLPFALAIRNGFLPRTIKNLHATYGPAVRVAPDEVYFADGQAWSDIFAASGQEKFPKNPTWFKKHQNGSHTLHSAPNEKHAELRRILAPSFSVRRLREQEPIIQATVGRFIAQLRRKAMEGSTINMKDWFNYLSFDIVGHLTFSQSFGCLERDSYHPWVNALQKYFKFLTFATTARFFPFLEFIVTRLIPKSLWSKRQKHLSHVQKIVTARVKEGKDGGHTDLLACVRQSRGELRLSDQDVEALISIMVLAGSEGTATSLLSILHHLLDAQQDLSRLILEVRSAFKDDAEIEMDALADLPFLNAVINEALRMSPSVPAHLTRVVPYPGASICGCWLPAETRVNISQHAMYRSPNHFSDPEAFQPARWLSDDSSHPVHVAKAFQPFSVGTRNCIGQQLGTANLRLITAKLFWNFDIARVGKSEEWETQKSWFVWEKRALNVTLNVARHRFCTFVDGKLGR